MKRVLFHWPLDPASRTVRLALTEKRLQFNAARLELPGDLGRLQELNPGGRVPVLREESLDARHHILEAPAILEYLEDTHPSSSLYPKDPLARAESRRLTYWFLFRFREDVLDFLYHERVEKPVFGLGAPDTANMREGRDALKVHLAYMEHLIGQRDWLAGRELTLADLAAGAALSSLDYFGDVPFDKFPLFRGWYARLKSRPCFRTLLEDRLPGRPPVRHYADLDF